MTSWTAADLPSFTGRTVIVTGANSGLGEVTARELAGWAHRSSWPAATPTRGNAAAAGMSGRWRSADSICRAWSRCANSPTASTATWTF